MSEFLPKSYEAPVGSNDYLKLQEGDNRLRVLSPAVIGWEGWKDNKPFRREGIEKNIEDDEVDIDEKFTKKPKINHFWAFLVWDYADEKIKLFTLTQKTVMKAIDGLVNDSDWGNPMEYDISIDKIVNGNRTSYEVKPYPPKKLSSDISDALDATELNPQDVFKVDADAEAERNFSKTGRPSSRRGR